MWAGYKIAVLKSGGNPNHDNLGRFASAPGSGGGKINTFTHTNGHSYTTTHSSGGVPLEIKGHYVDKNGHTQTHTLWSSESGKNPNKNTEALLSAGWNNAPAQGASSVAPTVVVDGDGNAAEYTNKGAVYDGTPPVGTVVGFDGTDEETKNFLATKNMMITKGKELLSSLSFDQKTALSYYTGIGYLDMNKNMRAGRPDADCQSLNSIFNNPKAVLDVPVTTNRGIAHETMEKLFPEGPKVGEVLGDAGFMSTSWDRSFSANWAGVESTTGAAVFQFTVPKGSKAIVERYQSEQEIILPPNSAIKIDSIEKYTDATRTTAKGWLIKGTYLGTKS